MRNNFFKLLLTAVVIIVGIFLTLQYFSSGKQSVEGKLMSQACEDIQSYETFRAEQEVDSLIEVIIRHRFPAGSGSNWTEAEILMDLRGIKDEIAFHNMDIEMYHKAFSKVLNKLAYAHMQDAKAFLEKNSKAAAKASMNEACHFIHDAMFFSRGKIASDQKQLLRKMRSMTESDVNMKEIEECMQLTIAMI